jgi:hypothetical protein
MKLKVHTRVRHKEYGEGKINKITPEKVYVAFNGKILLFYLQCKLVCVIITLRVYVYAQNYI